MFNNNLKRNHAKHEKCNTTIKQTSMASAARRQIILNAVLSAGMLLASNQSINGNWNYRHRGKSMGETKYT